MKIDDDDNGLRTKRVMPVHPSLTSFWEEDCPEEYAAFFENDSRDDDDDDDDDDRCEDRYGCWQLVAWM